MKKLAFLSVLILTACGSSTTLTSSQQPTTPPSSQPVNQTIPKSNFTPPEANTTYEGIGPVNIAKSNFYFAGDFQIMQGNPLFYDCMAGANIPIATDKGIYQELATQYNNKITNQGEILKVKMHGYFINQPTSDYPKQLVVTYVNDISKGTICPRQKELPGTWTAPLIGVEKGTVTMTMTNTFDFTANIVTSGTTKTIKGAWMMTSGDEIVLIYTDVTGLLGHSVAFNPENMTLFVPTQAGTLIFKKE